MYHQKIEQIKLIAASELTPEQKVGSMKALLDTIPMDCIDTDIDPTLKKILYQVCDHLSLPVTYVCSPGKQWKRVYAKQLYCYIAQKKTDKTKELIVYPIKVSRFMLWKYNKSIENLISYDDKVRQDLTALL